MIKFQSCLRGLRWFSFFSFLLSMTTLSAQPVPDEVKDSILKEGRSIAETRLAANSAIAVFARKNKFEGLDGYITYRKGNVWINAFYARSGDSMLIRYSLSNVDLKKPDAWSISGTVRKPSELEGELIKAREAVLNDMSQDVDFYQFYENIGFEPVILSKSGKYYVYVIPTTREQDYVIFGNDYLLVLDKDGKILKRVKLHNEMHSMPAKPEGQGTTMGSMHEHNGTESSLPTPTDIAVLLYNKDKVNWDQHIILSKKFMSIFYLDKEGMAIFPAGSFGK